MRQLSAIRESKEEQGLVLIVEGQEAILLLARDRDEGANHKIVLSSSGVGSYEVVFTVVKEVRTKRTHATHRYRHMHTQM